jgi:C4-dicarboxylate transporter/malic acid transport protein
VKAVGSPRKKMPVLHSFHPGWSGAVMGTAILGVVFSMNPGGFQILAPVAGALGIGMLALSWLLAIILAIPTVLRFIVHPEPAWKDLRHPVVSALYGTFPGGILVLSVATAAIGPSILPARAIFTTVSVLAWIGAVLALAVSLFFVYNLFVSPETAREHVNGGWFIPPVVSIIVPLALLPLGAHMDAESGRLLMVISYAFWGIGFFLFILVASLFFDRLVLRPMPAAALAPSLWILLGPAAVGGLSLLRMAQGYAREWGELGPAVRAGSTIGAIALWGFGFWWLLIAALLTLRYLRENPLGYSVGWWAFTFPLGALTVSTLALGRSWKMPAFEILSLVLMALLVFLWILVSVRTLIGLVNGEAWKR